LRASVASRTGQRKSFPQNIHVIAKLIRLWLRLRPFLSYGLIYGTSCRRGARPQHRGALVQPCRATAGTPHRTVRERALARYHTELEFLENIQEAKAAVETWRDC
jgi:hypothetical protein